MARVSKKKPAGKTVVFKKESDLPHTAISLSNTRYNKTGKWRSAKPSIDYSKCTSCMLCWKFCPDASIEIIDGKPYIDLDYCKGCMICLEECPIKAISIQGETK